MNSHIYNYANAYKSEGIGRAAAIIKLQAFKRWSDKAIIENVDAVFGKPPKIHTQYKFALPTPEERFEATLKALEKLK